MYANWKKKSLFWALALTVVLSTAAAGKKPPKEDPPNEDPPPYSITDLGGFAGGNSVQSEARGINNPDGDGLVAVVGNSRRSDGMTHGILWDVTDAGILLGNSDLGLPIDPASSSAKAVNDEQLVIGNASSMIGPETPAWFATPTIGITALPDLGGTEWRKGSQVLGLNNLGDIVGTSIDTNNEDRGAIWNVDALGNVTGPVDLGDFHPYDINDLGVMAGQQANGTAAIAWFDGPNLVVQPIGRLNPDHPTQPRAINNLGEVVGASFERADGGAVYLHAFYWSAATEMSGLGDFGGGSSYAYDINDDGYVVGWATSKRAANAFVWRDGVMTDLNSAISSDGASWQLTYAYSINNAGQIVGLGAVGSRRNRQLHGFLLTRNP